MIRDRKKKRLLQKKNLRFLKVKFVKKKTIPSVVYPRLMQPRMLQLSIRVLSERLHLRVMYCGVNPNSLVPIGGIGKEALRLEINNTKTLLCYKLYSSLIKTGTKKNGWANKHPSRLYFGYPYNHRRLLK